LAVIRSQSNEQVADIANCAQVTLRATSFEKLYEALHDYKEEYLGEFSNGVATFLYSLLLTRGAENVRQDFDMEDNSLIG
jgi:hypothetical protein